MMRDMSSPMDASLSTRNQGQLISTEQVVTRPVRVGNMREVPLESPGNRNLSLPQARRAKGLADITVTGLGTTSWAWLGVAALSGIVLWKLTAGKRAKAQARAARAVAALKGS